KARTEPTSGTTNPEELLAAAHSACFSMALSNELDQNGTTPTSVRTSAEVTFVAGTGITGIHLRTVASVPGIEDGDFQRLAQAAKEGCPVSGALQATPITLDATLDQYPRAHAVGSGRRRHPPGSLCPSAHARPGPVEPWLLGR